MNPSLRKGLGACVGWANILTGRRHRRLAKLRQGRDALCIFSHSPVRAAMEGMVCWLQGNGFRFVSQEDLRRAWEGCGALPPQAVWLSFDDGWRRNLMDVVPVLEREGIPATFFIAPEATRIGCEWTDLVPTSRGGIESASFLRMPNRERKARVSEWLETARQNNQFERTLMSGEEIEKLAKNSLFSFENHTLTHASAAGCSPEEFLLEVREADRVIREWTGKPTSLICYPFGLWNDPCERLLRAGGWMPVTSDPGILPIMDGVPPRLPRNLFYNQMSLAENTCRILQAWRRISFNQTG